MMLAKTIFLLATAAALIGCADVPFRTTGLSNGSVSESDTPRHLLAEAIAARKMTMDRYRAGRHDGNASSPSEIHAAFAALSERRTVHSVPIARIVKQALATQAQLEAETAAHGQDGVADGSVARIEAQIYKVFASWPERRAPVEAVPTRRTRTLRAATTATPTDICDLINISFVEEVYGARVTCSTLHAPDSGTEV